MNVKQARDEIASLQKLVDTLFNSYRDKLSTTGTEEQETQWAQDAAQIQKDIFDAMANIRALTSKVHGVESQTFVTVKGIDGDEFQCTLQELRLRTQQTAKIGIQTTWVASETKNRFVDFAQGIQDAMEWVRHEKYLTNLVQIAEFNTLVEEG